MRILRSLFPRDSYIPGELLVILALIAILASGGSALLNRNSVTRNEAPLETWGEPIAYVVKPGDTYQSIAERAVQARVMASERLTLNAAILAGYHNNPSATKLKPGMTVWLPMTSPYWKNYRPNGEIPLGRIHSLLGNPGAEMQLEQRDKSATLGGPEG